MRAILGLLFLAGTLLLGCRPNAAPPISGTTNGIVAPFEGKYDIVGNPECTVIMSNGFYSGATPYNLAGDLDGSGQYAAKSIGIDTWELDMTNRPWAFIVRVEGGSVWLRGKDLTNQVELRRK